MAKIFISYSHEDSKLLMPYIDRLKKNHQVLIAEDLLEYGKTRQAMINAQREADGTIVFLTRKSVMSPHINSEIGAAYTYMNDVSDPKFLIPITFGKIELPGIISNLFALKADKLDVDRVIIKIEEGINDFLINREKIQRDILAPEPDKDKTRQIQTDLKELGFFNSAIDGMWGPATANAIKRVQKESKLRITGQWNNETEETIKKLIGAVPEPVPPPEEHIEKATVLEEKYWLFILPELSLDKFIPERAINFKSFIEDKNQPKPGDKGFVFSSLTEKIISSAEVLEVIQEVKISDTSTLLKIRFNINHRIDSGIDFPDLSRSENFQFLKSQMNDNLIFSIEKYQYESFLQVIKDRIAEKEFKPSVVIPDLPDVSSDSAAKELRDQLDFEYDINALASVIAYREVTPPLAIGLFGNWGSGKSFFMNKLQVRIEELRKDKSGKFCEEVVSINFNSWNYSDSNLWASLITKIFEDLEKYANKREGAEVKKLFENLNSTKELLEDAETRKKEVINKLDTLQKKKDVFDKDVEDKASKLETLSFDEIVKESIKDEGLQPDIDELKNKYSFLHIKEYKDIESQLEILKDFGNKTVETVKLFFSFWKGKKIIAIISLLLIAGTVFALTSGADFIKNYFDGYRSFIAAAAGVLIQLVAFLKPAIRLVNAAHKRMKSISETIERLKEKAKEKFKNQQEELKTELNEAEHKAGEILREIELLKIEQTKVETEISEIASGRKVLRFIESRVTDKRYTDSLGIISWIRKDFEELDFLFKQQHDAKKLAMSGRKKIEDDIFKVERIVLYIDDLDRCNEEIVVKVLEAIHLLLAFELFVVVVGVDPRWMNNALNVKYSKLLAGAGAKEKATDEDIKNNNHPATSFDYLEKIFQIPFALKQIDNSAKAKLIRSQAEVKVEVKSESPEESKPEADKEKLVDSVPLPVIKPEENMPGTENIPVEPVVQPIKEETSEIADSEDENNVVKTEELRALKISEDEIVFMQEIAFLIGDSPRTIKRYINIYRIIRTHRNFSFTDSQELHHYFAAMILLAFITGLPNAAKDFFDSIKNDQENKFFNLFLDDYLGKNKVLPDEFNALSRKIKTDRTNTLKEFEKIKINKFKKNLDLISRFSFRSIS